MGGTSPSTGMWQGEVFALSDCLVVIVCAAPFTVFCIGVQFDGTYNCPCRPRHNQSWCSIPSPNHWALGILESDCFQIQAAAKRARLACWNKACWVGGIESSDFRLCVNITFIASFSNSASQFLLYMNTVQRSRRRICSESSMRLLGSWIIATKVLVTIG